LEFFLKTPKQIKIKTYMRNVLKNYKNYDVAFVSQVVMFVYSSGLGSEMKELLEKVVENNHVNMYVYIGRYSEMNQLLLFVDADMRMFFSE
jgi:2-hydroxy-3-keto-5-methylthiopentenyl-1-phosphate phosphatase